MLKGTTLEKLDFGHILDAADDIANAPRLLKMLKGTTLEKLDFGHILDAADDIANAVEVCKNEGSQIPNKLRHEKTGCWGL